MCSARFRQDEANPDDRDAGLDLYDPANANQPPYGADFIATYRNAQIARNRRITAWVLEMESETSTSGYLPWN